MSIKGDPVLWLSPAHASENSFIDQFTQSLKRQGFGVEHFDWTFSKRKRPLAIILHWPDEFFTNRGFIKNFKSYIKLLWLYKLKLRKTKIIWIAHNLKPHDSSDSGLALTRLFFRLLSGVVYLSEYSRERVEKHYNVGHKPALVIVHGHYKNVLTRPETAPLRLSEERPVRLAFVGQIRAYKGVLELAQAFREMSQKNVMLTIAGRCKDRKLEQQLHQLAEGGNIHLDVRRDLLPQDDLEQAIDRADAVILPYRDIMNSGSALLVLSRSRPVIAPHSGSFPELRAGVGDDWVHLYSGEVDPQVLLCAVTWVRKRDNAPTIDLTPYGWNRVGEQLESFLIKEPLG